MLKLEKMTLAGFKSFSDPTEVVFPDGITAVVGPNGCGKSNIGDAINWVLGEQSARMLRGTSMQDVIFNGSEARRPQGMAEVSLHLSGMNGSPDGRTRDVVLTRRLFRSGESEYLVNGARSRLKDIQDILREARIGAQTYATIEQGRIEQILNAKPRDRRLIIEEAAGIAGFKHKRRLAELKLEATQANLLRVNDIVIEVRRQIGSLKRQAAKARRYQRLRDELRDKERHRFGRRALLLDENLARLRDVEAQARQDEAASAARLATLESRLEADRLSLEEAERALREAALELHRIEMEAEREESRVQQCRERIVEAEQAASRLDGEGSDLANRRAALKEQARVQAETLETERQELEDAVSRLAEKQTDLDEIERSVSARKERIEDLRRRLLEAMSEAAERRNCRKAIEEALERNAQKSQRLHEEREIAEHDQLRFEGEVTALASDAQAHREDLERARQQLHDLSEQHVGARARLEAKTEALAAAREGARSAQSRLHTLEDVATRFAGFSDGVKMLLSPAVALSTRGVVADFMEAARDVEQAADAYLEAILPAVILEHEADVGGAVELLRSREAGRTFLLCAAQPAGGLAVGSSRASLPDSLLRDPRVLGRLQDRLTLTGGGADFLRDRIGDAVIVDGIESALALHREHPGADYLTLSGDVVYASGVISAGGHRGSDRGLLAHNRRTQEARAELGEASGRAAQLQSVVEEARAELSRLETEIGVRQASLEEDSRRLVELDMRLGHLADERQRAGRRLSVLSDEAAASAHEAAGLVADLDGASREVAEAEEDHRRAAEELTAEAISLEEREKALRDLAEATAVLRAEVVVRKQRRASAEKERDRLDETIADLDARIRNGLQELDAARLRGEEARQTLARSEAELVRHLAERESRSSAVAEGERVIEERRGGLQEQESLLREARAELEGTRGQSRTAELERAGAEADRRHLDDLCLQELGISATEAAAGIEVETEPVDPDTLDAAIAELRSRIEAMGPVNLTAIEEFAGLEERYKFMTLQQKDLEDSMESLRETIRRINRSSRERFSAVFEAIRLSFQEVFRVLFNGGRADLRLEEGEDVLECGVEILAQPPGKHLTNVHLLSGGEKSMAAIALLFAIFKCQPSPFCLLDEVDAALDDVNVNRFTRLLRDYAAQTQFIMITHNKRSMETANLLYGVTMEEPGVSKLMSLKLD